MLETGIMIKQAVLIVFLCVVLVVGLAASGSGFYHFVLPKFRQPPKPKPKPKPPKPSVQLYPLNPIADAAVPRIAPLPGTTIVRVAHQTSNAHQAWALANMGKVTDPGSTFARHGLTMRFRRMEAVKDRILALKAMATAYERGEDAPDPNSPLSTLLQGWPGAHFITISGDSSNWIMREANQALKTINPEFEAEIIGFAGISRGEDRLLGPPEWQDDPKRALGGVVAATPHTSAWNVMLFWCAENDILFNPDPLYYDPRALNVEVTDTPDEAASLFIDETPVERIFLADGKSDRGRSVRKGEKRRVAITGVATRTPWDVRIASERGELVTVASTKQYPNQSPQLIVGLKQWNFQNQDVVTRMLTALYESSQAIIKSRREVKDKTIEAKSDDDVSWRAAQYTRELLGAESPAAWYDYYDGTVIESKDGLTLKVGGAQASTLQHNMVFFGLANSGPDRGALIFNRFAQFTNQYDSGKNDSGKNENGKNDSGKNDSGRNDSGKNENGRNDSGKNDSGKTAALSWDRALSSSYIQSTLKQTPALGQGDDELPAFSVEVAKGKPQLDFQLFFGVGEETLNIAHKSTLQRVASQVVEFGQVSVEIHAYTDSSGDARRNRLLAQLRGFAVYDWLENNLGENFPAQVDVVAHGEDDLLVEDQVDGQYIESLMAHNRQVLVKLSPIE